MTQRQLGTVVITGGSSGLGAATVEAVEAAGGKPVVLDRVAPSSGVDHVVVDLSDTAAAEQAVQEVVERYGDIDAIVTAAGTDACGRLEDVPTEKWEKVVQVNLFGTVAVIRAALPSLKKTQGKVLTVASTLGIKAVSDATAYCASKFGVVGFTRSLATETAGEIGVTLLIPGGMHTAFFDDRDPQYRPPSDAKLNRPEDVAGGIVTALLQPPGCEIREMVIAASTESSWP